MLAKITKDEFEKGIRMHQFEMYRLAFSIVRTEVDAQNAVRNAIIRAFEHRRSLGIPRKFKSWMIQIVADESKRLLKQSNETVAVNDVIHINVENQASCEPTASEDDHGLWNMIMQLEDDVRPILVLFYYENYSPREISHMMRSPERMVKDRLSRAREKLKISLID